MSKTSKLIYIAGKVTGLPDDQVQAKFRAAQAKLEAQGYSVINPFELVKSYNEHEKMAPNRNVELFSHSGRVSRHTELLETWEACMRYLLPFLCIADEVHVMRCWQDSRGAIMERDTAKRLGIPVHHI